MVTKAAKAAKKRAAENKKFRKNKGLLLSGVKPDFSKYKIKKNQQVPQTRHTSNKWDHFINDLDKGDCIEMKKSEAVSFSNRGRNLGYVVVLRKQGDDVYAVWFGGKKK